MTPRPFRVRTLERAARDRCLSDDEARTVDELLAARWFRDQAAERRWRALRRAGTRCAAWVKR